MPTITVGFAEIEERLGLLRRRLNSLALQHALYISGSVAVLAVALLVALALRGGASAFRIGFWALLGAMALGLVAAARQARQSWFSLDRTVRWADREAGLDDRLATLVAHRAHPQTSRLAGLLVAQVLALRQRWHPHTLVRRRVPRSIYLFAGSLAVLAITAFLERLPVAPTPHAFGIPSKGRGGSPERLGDGTLLLPPKQHEPNDQQFTATSAGDDGTDSQPITKNEAPGAAPSKARPTHAGGATAQAAGRAADGTAKSRANRGQAADAAAQPTDALTDRLQNLIRETLGAPPQESGGTMGERRTPSNSPQAHQQHAMRPREGKPEAAPDGSAPDQSRKKEGAAAKQLTTTGQQEGSSSGSGTAAGGSAGQGTLLAGRRETGSAATQAKTFQLNLNSLAFGARSLMEPQKPSQKQADEMTAPRAPSEAEPSEYDRPDDPVLRPAIAPEYEPIIRRLFSRE